MIRNTLANVALAAVCAIGVAAPKAQAQTDRFVDLSPDVKARMLAECGPMPNAHLRASCMDTIAIEADRRSGNLRDGLTGGGDGRMNPTDRTFQGPDRFDPHLGR
jgi:hypothetical protein